MNPKARYWTAFSDGLKTTSLASSFAILAFAVLEFAALCLFVDERALAHLPRNFLKARDVDDRAQLTVDACRLRHRPNDAFNVVYMGASTARLALFDWRTIGPSLTGATAERTEFWNLSADGERVEEYLILAHHLPDGMRGVVVAMISDTRRDHVEVVDGEVRMREKTLLGLDVSSLGPLAEELGETTSHQTGNFFIDHLDFFAARRVAAVRFDAGPSRPRPRPRRGFPEKWQARARVIDMAPGPRALVRKHLANLELLKKALDDRGVPLILLGEPVSPAFDQGKSRLKEFYLAEVQAFGERFGVTYWDLNEEAALETEDFWDPVHIGSDVARRRFQTALVGRLGAYIEARRGSERRPGKP